MALSRQPLLSEYSVAWVGTRAFRPQCKAGSSDIAHLQTSAVDRPKGSGEWEERLARDSRWFDMARARRSMVFCGFCGDQRWRFSSPKGLAEPQTSLGRGAGGCALALCDSAKLLPGLQPGGLRSPLVLSLITPSHVVLAFPFYFNDHSILLPQKTLHSHDLIGIFLSQRASCDHISCI